MKRRSVWLAILLTGCATPSRDITPALQGNWGGEHIGLTIGTTDTDVQFDCAEGTIFAPYLVNMDGTFNWGGTYQRGTGGPVRVGQQPPEVPAQYVGETRGGEMTLSVRLDDGQVIGPFQLERFQDAQLLRCL